jgi:phosphoenolpyruvate carboxykinase (ATP)
LLIRAEDITIEGFRQVFRKIVRKKQNAQIKAIINNPPDLFQRAKSYGTHFKNGSWGWTSNIWNRSASGTAVINNEDELRPQHKELMLRVLEHILSQGPLIQVDANLGQFGSKGLMRCRLYCDPQFPDIAYRWSQLNFKADRRQRPDVELFCIPHYLENPCVPGSNQMLRVIRFPRYNYSIVSASSYQGECKKGFLSHWIYHIYKKGGTGEHASLKEFTVKKTNGKNKRIVMCVWGLSGSGKSTHGMYVVTKRINERFKQQFAVDILSFVSEQVIKNDDIVGIFKDQVVSPERGSWTKTEDVNQDQIAMYKAGMSPRALHENTEFDSVGNVSFKGRLLQYHGKPNQNARTVFYLQDTGYHDGNVDSSAPLNMAVFISPGYNSDYAWLKIADPAFAAKVLADGRTTGHPAQGREGVGQEKYSSRYCLPFTMGVGSAAHVKRFYEFLEERSRTDNPIEVYLINTTGRVGTKFSWVKHNFGGQQIIIPKTKFIEVRGKIKPESGTGPSIEETELFLFQAARGAVKYQPHPIWGKKVLVPIEVEGISKRRLEELNPFTYHSKSTMQRLLKAQIVVSKYHLDKQCPGLPPHIYNAMDF